VKQRHRTKEGESRGLFLKEKGVPNFTTRA
jgi:hypothetical protein